MLNIPKGSVPPEKTQIQPQTSHLPRPVVNGSETGRQMTSGRQSYRIHGLLDFKMCWQQARLSNLLTHQTTTGTTKWRKRRARIEHSRIKGWPPLIAHWALGVHQNVPVYNVKPMSSVGIDFMIPTVVMDNLTLASSSVIMSPPKMSFLLDAERMPELQWSHQ